MTVRCVVALVLAAGLCGCGEPNVDTGHLDGLSGPYLGQPLPGVEPELFAPGIVSSTWNARDVSMTPDGSEIYFGVFLGRYAHSAVMVTRRDGGGWTRPEVASFAEDPATHELEAQVAPDGSRVYFLSDRPSDRGEDDGEDLWVATRQGDRWSAPSNLGPPVNTADDEYFPSVTEHGDLYFTRQTEDRRTALWRARRAGAGFAAAERLPEVVNSSPAQFNAFVAPDESYLIFAAAGRRDSLGGADYYVCFRSPSDEWSEPIHLPAPINSPATEEYSASVSPDGRVLFFMSDRAVGAPDSLPERLSARWLKEIVARPGHGNACIWWVDAGFLEGLRPAGL